MKINPWAGRHPLAPKILRTKYLHIDWTNRPDGRKYRRRVNYSRKGGVVKSHGMYLQIFRLEVSVWWR